MEARPYQVSINEFYYDFQIQVELFEKAKTKNIIVYLGTGSGKTFIAVMLIKHFRDKLQSEKKVIKIVVFSRH